MLVKSDNMHLEPYINYYVMIKVHEIYILSFIIDHIVSATRSLTCRDDLDSKWRLLLAENELSRVSLLSRYIMCLMAKRKLSV